MALLFKQLVVDLKTAEANSCTWALCALTEAASIRNVLSEIKECIPSAKETCDHLLKLPHADLESHHSSAFRLFSTCVAPNAVEDLRAETVAALTPFEQAQQKHRSFLIQRAKQRSLKKTKC